MDSKANKPLNKSIAQQTCSPGESEVAKGTETPSSARIGFGICSSESFGTAPMTSQEVSILSVTDTKRQPNPNPKIQSEALRSALAGPGSQNPKEMRKETMKCSLDPEVDSRDELSANARTPLHAQSTRQEDMNQQPKRPRLTLSAFRRPEQTVRLTGCDPTRLLENEYDLRAPGCRVLGHGAFSTVRLAVSRRNNSKVAVKSIAKHDALRHRRLRLGGRCHLDEWEILRMLRDHPNVVSLLDLFETDEDIHLVMEYCKGGELFDAIQKKKLRSRPMRRGRSVEGQAAQIISQILSALVDLHGHNICHRDVKLENILLSSDDDLAVKLCDFGVARQLHNRAMADEGSDGEASPLAQARSRSLSFYGTDYYAAPEVRYGGAHGTAADVYSLGVCLYILLCGFPPVITEIWSGRYDHSVQFPETYWNNISSQAKCLIQQMLHPDPAKRIDAASALKNNWILQNCSLTSLVENPMAASPMADLENLRTRLFKSLDQRGSRKKRLSLTCSPRKRPRTEQSPSPLKVADLFASKCLQKDVNIICGIDKSSVGSE